MEETLARIGSARRVGDPTTPREVTMSNGRKSGLVLAVLVAAFFVLRKSGMVPGSNPLKDGHFTATVPLFPGAKFRETGGGNYYDQIGGPVTFTSTSWFFDITAPVSEVAAYYRANMSGLKPEEAAEGEVGFTWIPPGAKEGEDVSIWIESGELRISESVKAGG
jgi:hypothetical protein